jgi:hypothetical protein
MTMAIGIMIGLGVLLLWLIVCTFVMAMCMMAARGDGRGDVPALRVRAAMPRGRASACRQGSAHHADLTRRRRHTHIR